MRASVILDALVDFDVNKSWMSTLSEYFIVRFARKLVNNKTRQARLSNQEQYQLLYNLYQHTRTYHLFEETATRTFVDHLLTQIDWQHRFSYLHFAHLLTQENFDALLNQTAHADSLASGFQNLARAGLLTQENFDALLNQAAHAKSLSVGFRVLHDAHLLTQENREALIGQAAHAESLGAGFWTLDGEHLLTQENFDAFIAVAQADIAETIVSVARSMVLLNNADNLTHENRLAIQQRPHHALIIAKQYGEGFDKNERVDADFAKLLSCMRPLGEAYRDIQHPMGKLGIEVLTKIGVFATTYNTLDSTTANITASELMQKPRNL